MNNFTFILTMAVIAVALPLALHKFSEFFTREDSSGGSSLDVKPDPATSKFYLGNFWYRQTRWIDISSRIMPFFVVASILFIWQQNDTGSRISLERLLLVVGIIFAVIILWGVLGFGTKFTANMYPEFVITSDRLWYRFFNQWHYLSWSDIQTVTKTRNWVAGSLGILIYSEKLPDECINYARIYGTRAGRALIVFNTLPNMKEFEADLLAHLQQQPQVTSSSVEHASGP